MEYPSRQVFDPHVPNVARVYDFLLGGKDNYAADRTAAERLLRAVPDAAIAARQNRAFLGRLVKFLVRDCGIRQIIDIGTGLPAQGCVHEVAWQFAADTRIVYVDNDPVVTLHSETLLSGNAGVSVIDADLRYPAQLLDHSSLRSSIDLDKPVAVLLIAILHFVEDEAQPYQIVDHLTEAIAPGSFLAVSHVTADALPAEAAEEARATYNDSNAPGIPRTQEEISSFFHGLEIVPPGIVDAASWKSPIPVRRSARAIFYAGVGRKPELKSGIGPAFCGNQSGA
jgi:hypothetical protein